MERIYVDHKSKVLRLKSSQQTFTLQRDQSSDTKRQAWAETVLSLLHF